MQIQRFSRRQFLSLAGATGSAALLAACAVVPATDGGAGVTAEPVTMVQLGRL